MKLICELTESVDYELIEEGAGGKATALAAAS